jgi:hypothetical protein
MVTSESGTVAPVTDDNRARLGVGVGVLLVGGAFILYHPALRIGLLSDDYALLMWARRLELAPRDWGQIRPLPILAWSAIAGITTPGRTAAALHGLSIALHGLNAVLVWILAGRLTTSMRTALTAAALFLAMPLSVEPVAWGSGIFDVMLATFTLLLGVTVTARQQLRLTDAALCLLLTIGMMGSKETGVIAGPLTVLLYWARWSTFSRRVLALGGTQLLLAGTYTLGRELTGRLDHRLVPRVDVAGVARLVGGTARALLMPLHRDVIQAHPAIAGMIAGAIIVLLIGWVFRWRRLPGGMRLGVLAAAGTLVCVAPAIRLFGITPDLQGTRYVYLAGAWWSIALASALLDGWNSSRAKTTMAAAAVLAVAGGAVLTRLHLEPWIQARTVRDRVLLRLISIPPSCHEAAATGVPDNVAGAYVFRNGLNEALATLGRSYEWVDPARAAPECVVNIE